MEGGVQPTERASNQQSYIQKCVKVLWPFRHRIKGNPEDNLKYLKEAIKFHFKHCVDKAKEGPRIPLKAIFHVLLIGLVIPQVSSRIDDHLDYSSYSYIYVAS